MSAPGMQPNTKFQGASSADVFRGDQAEAEALMKANHVKKPKCTCDDPWVERQEDGPHCVRCGVDL